MPALRFCILPLLVLASALGAEPLAVWVTILPQKYLVERVGGERVSVEALVAPGSSPATYAPSVRQMARLAKAEVFFAIGLPVERAIVPRIEASMRDLELVHLEPPADVSAHHGHGPDCVHGEADPHVWLNPIAATGYAERICAVLKDLEPDGADFYAARTAQLVSELEALHLELLERMAPYRGRAFFINHPSLGHFAEAYGLRQLAVEEGGDAPGARRMSELLQMARREEVGAVFSQLQFEGSSVEVLADALGVPVIEINPLEEDYFISLRAIADAMDAAFGTL